MKKSVLSVSAMMVLGAMDLAAAVNPTYGYFGLFNEYKVAYDSDMDQICKDTFGSQANLADWTEIEVYVSSEKSLEALVSGLQLNIYANAFIAREGDQFTGGRHYYISFTNGEPLSEDTNYEWFDTADTEHYLTLGRKDQNDYVLCSNVKQNEYVNYYEDIKAVWTGENASGDGLKNLVYLEAYNTTANKSSDTGFAMKNARADFQWNFRTAEGSEGFMATKNGTAGAEFTINNPTDHYSNVSLVLGNGARCDSTGQWINASSKAYKENIKEMDAMEAKAAFEKLNPVTFNFKRDRSKELIAGFIAEEVPDLVATKERDGLSALEIAALLTKVVKEQQKELANKDAEVQALESRVERLETLLTNAINELAKENTVALKK